MAIEPMRGGLESTVARAHVSSRRQPGRIPSRIVIKELPIGGEREAEVYDLLWQHLAHPPTARMLGRDVVADRTYLYLEDVRASAPWPWRDTTLAGLVCRELARFHDAQTLPRELFEWDYEGQLARSADATLDAAATARDASGRRCWTRLGELRRVVATLPKIRRQLLARPATVIHGDMHPGNVILRPQSADVRVALIDWGRARLGSPLEDVASWLQSLGCWEPEARRRHDTLIRAYLETQRDRSAFTPDVRVEYWLASVSNGLSGAIRYHLAVLSNPDSPESTRYDSGRALVAWQRVVRRAAAFFSTSLGR